MPVYQFETMTPEEALQITGSDRIDVARGSANRTTVIFNADGTISLTIEDRTLTFNASELTGGGIRTMAVNGRISFPDGSLLYIGDDAANLVDRTVTRKLGFYGGLGADTVQSHTDEHLIQGNQGNDLIQLFGSRYTIYGGQDDDSVFLGGLGGNFVQGNRGNDSIFGSQGGDTLLGGQGNDTVFGSAGVDFINGNLGDDVIDGRGVLRGEGGNDSVTAGASGVNSVYGGEGNDRLGSVLLLNDNSGGLNFLWGEDGHDTINANSPLHDELFGGLGNDFLTSNTNKPGTGDLLEGGPGADSLQVVQGASTLSGGADSDRFEFVGLPGGLPRDDVLHRVIDWETEDRIMFLAENRTFLPNAQNYAELSASTLEAARLAAEAEIGRGKVFVAVQLGADVVVFASDRLLFSSAFYLVGRSLNDIDADNLAS